LPDQIPLLVIRIVTAHQLRFADLSEIPDQVTAIL
jgi:hypothetical protein